MAGKEVSRVSVWFKNGSPRLVIHVQFWEMQQGYLYIRHEEEGKEVKDFYPLWDISLVRVESI